jgi:prepilin-type N-terminal cleavage/methylation domain-containing protein
MNDRSPSRIAAKAPACGAGAGPRPEAGFSLPELLVAMVITVSLMAVVFTLMRQNQGIFETETGVTSMNENVRAAVDLLTREIQAAGTGLRGMSAPILGVDGENGHGDRIAILLGDPNAPVAQVRTAGASQAVLILPGAGGLDYRDDRGKPRRLYEPGDRYVLYNDAHFVVVRVGTASLTATGDVAVTFAPDKSNLRPKFGDYRFNPVADANGALFARLDEIVTYRYDRDGQTLERRENHGPWAAVARGIIGFQVRYRALTPEKTLTEPLDEPPADREEIRSVVLTVRARTPDVEPGTPSYRETAERFEVTPRNMRITRDAGPDAGSTT